MAEVAQCAADTIDDKGKEVSFYFENYVSLILFIILLDIFARRFAGN